VAIRRAMWAFLLAFGYNHVSNLNGYRDMMPERYPGHVLDLLWSRDVISHVTIRLPVRGFPIGGQWSPCVYLARLMRYSASNIMGSLPWPFAVTWRHRSRDRSTPHGGFPIAGQWWPGVYLARLLRYSAWNTLRSRPWPLGSRDVIDHVTILLPIGCFLQVVNGDQASISHGYWDIQPGIHCGHDLDLWGHVTSSITWPFYFPSA